MSLGTCWWGNCWRCLSGSRPKWTTRRSSRDWSTGRTLSRKRTTRTSGRTWRRSTTFSRCSTTACTTEWRTRWNYWMLRRNKCYRTRNRRTARRSFSGWFVSTFRSCPRSCKTGRSKTSWMSVSSTSTWQRLWTVWTWRRCSSSRRTEAHSISTITTRSRTGCSWRYLGNRCRRRWVLYDFCVRIFWGLLVRMWEYMVLNGIRWINGMIMYGWVWSNRYYDCIAKHYVVGMKITRRKTSLTR